MKGFQLPVDFEFNFDEKKLDQIEAKIAKLFADNGVELNIDSDAAMSALDQLLKEVDGLAPLLDGLDANIDATQAQKILDDLMDRISALEDVEINFRANDDISKAADAFDEMELSLERQRKAYAFMVADGKATEEELAAMNQQLIEATEQVDKMKEAFESAGKAAEAVNEEAGGSNKALNFLAISEGANQLKEVFGGIIERGGEYNLAMKQVQAQTGLVGQAFEDFKGQAEEAFTRGVGESLAEGIKIYGEAQRAFGDAFQGQVLTDLTVSLNATGKAFGKEFGEIAAQAGTFQKAFQTDSKDTAALVTLTMRDAKSTAGDALEVLGEFSPLMVQAGYDAAEFVGILKNADGTFQTAKVADAVKELGIRLKSGDVVTGINDLVASFSDRIPNALSDTLTAVAQEGQAGLKSTKEVIQESTAAIEKAFTDGKIDTNIRQGLQAAFAGAPAEELGADMYAKVFGAPIDTSLINAQAAAAQASIDKAFNPSFAESFSKGLDAIQEKAAAAFVPFAKGGMAIAEIAPKLNAIKGLIPEETFKKFGKTLQDTFDKGLGKVGDKIGPLKNMLGSLGPALMGPWGLAIAAAIGLVTLFFTQTEEGKEIWDGITDAVTNLYEQAKPALEAIGSVLGSVGKLGFEVLIGLGELLWDTISGIGGAIASLFSAGEDGGGDGLQEFFDGIVRGAELTKLAIEGIIAAFKSMKDNIGGAIKALLSGDLSGFADSLGRIGDDASKAFVGGVEASFEKLKTQKLQEKLTGALEIKGNLDKNNALGDLVEKYKNAKDEVTRQNLAGQIAAQVPGAVNSVKTVVDETTGKVSEVYDVAIDKAQEYVDNQNKVLSEGVDGGKDAFFQLLVKQSAEVDNNKAKLQEMANAITAAAAAGQDTSKLTKEYEKQKEATEKSAEGLKNIVVQGKGLGVTAGEIEKMGTKSGKSAEESKKLANGFVLVDKEVRKTAVSAKVLGDAFQQAMSRVDGALNTTVSALDGARLKMADIKRQIADEKDPAKLQQLRQEYKDLTAEVPKFKKQLKDLAVEQRNLQEINAKDQKIVELAQESTLTKKQRELSQGLAQLDLAKRILDIRTREQRLFSGREEDIFDQLQAALALEQKQKEIFEKKADSLGYTAEQAQLVYDTMKATGTLDINKDAAVRIHLMTEEGGQRFDLAKDFGNEVANLYEQGVNVLDIRTQIKTQIDPTELIQLQQDLDQKTFDIQVELGFKGPADILERTSLQLEKVQSKMQSTQVEIDAINQKLADPKLAESERGRLEQRLVQYTTAITQLKLQELDLQTAVRSTTAEIFDKRAALAQEEFDRNYDRVVAGYDIEQTVAETFIAKKLELENEAIEEAKNNELAAIDEVMAARQKALDEQQKQNDDQLAQLEKLGLLSEAGIDTERELQERKLQAAKEYEEKKKQIEEDARIEKEAAEKKAADRALALQKQADGAAIILTARRERQELELQRNSLQEQKRIAEAKAILSQKKEDREAVDAIGRQLDDVAKKIDEKGSLLLEATGTLQTSMSDTFATLFSGNEEAITDSFRSFFGLLSGALKKAGTAFVVDIVLSSPWLKTAIGLNPFLGAAITGTVTGLLSGLVGKVLDPVISSLTSFASGGRIDSPMLALVGDGTRLGGSSDREWIFRDDQLWKVIASAQAASTRIIQESLNRVETAILGLGIIGEIGNGVIYLAATQEKTKRQQRQRE